MSVKQQEQQHDAKMLRKFSESSSDGSCVLCCEKIKFYAIGHCDHPICFKCSSRMRILARQMYCAACRTEMDKVLFTSDVQPFKQFKLNNFAVKGRYGIQFQTKEIKKEFDKLLDYYCVECKEEEEKQRFYSLQELRTHLRKVHEKQFCDICLQNLSIFPQEYKVYTKKELVSHRKQGDKDEKSYRGHPECRFCDDRYFDNDALLRHLRKNHFWCHFCEHDGKQDYFNVYKDLRKHFMAEHYLCDEGNCFNEKFTSVFRDKIDYQAHKLAQHGKNLNKMQAKEARKVDIDYSFSRRQQKTNVINGNDYEEVRDENRNRNFNRYTRARDRPVNYLEYDDVERDRKALKAKKLEEQRNSPVEGTVDMATALTPPEEENNDDDVIGLSEHVNKHDQVQKEKENNPVKLKVTTQKKPEKSQPEVVKPEVVKPEKIEKTVEGIDSTDFPTLSGVKPTFPIKKTAKPEEDPFPALASAPKKTVHVEEQKWGTALNGIPIKSVKKGKGKSWKQQTGRDLNNSNDFPTLGGTKKKTIEHEGVTKSPKLNEKKTLKEQPVKDPPPGLTKKQQPPGLFKTDQKNTPQGSSKQPIKKQPPPGLSQKDPVKKQAPPPGLGKSDRPSERPPGLEKATGNKTDNKMERNFRLLALLQAFLDEFNLGIFKKLSGDYRRDLITGQAYYTGIKELLGENLKIVFSELVALLPDENKQKELLLLHNNEEVRVKESKEINRKADYTTSLVWGASSKVKTTKEENEITENYCPECGDTFPKALMDEHMLTHSGEAFPALPTAVRKKKAYNFMPVRTNRQIPIKNAWK